VNIVDLIKDQLSSEVMGGLASMLGKDQATTSKAATGAIPALLSVLAGLVKSPGGIEKVISALRTFDAGSVANVVSALRSGTTAPIQQKGGDLLGSLFGSGTLSMLVSAISKFSNLETGSSKSLLSMMLPLVLGVISNHFKAKPVDSQSLSSFFRDQASGISAALPSGLSLAEIPGASAVKSAADEAATGMPGWVYALVGLGVLGLLGWYFYSQGTQEPVPNPEAPAVANAPTAGKPVDLPKAAPASDIVDLPDQLSKVYTSAIDYLTGVKDVATAEAAVPKLRGLDATIDRLTPLINKLPDSAKAAIAGVQTKYLSQLKDLIATVLAIPGVGDKLKPLADGLVSKLSSINTSARNF